MHTAVRIDNCPRPTFMLHTSVYSVSRCMCHVNSWCDDTVVYRSMLLPMC